MSEKNEKFVLPKGNTIWQLKPHKQVRGKNKEITKEHPANFLYGTAKKHIIADTSNGNPLTYQEQLFFESPESGMGFKPGDLAISQSKDNYWNNYLNRVPLNENGIKIDISTPSGYLMYKYILSNKDKVAPHPDSLKGSSMRKTFQWCFYPEGYSEEAKAEEYNITAKIYKYLGKIEDNKVEMINFLMAADPKKFISSSTTMAFLKGELNKLAKEQPTSFIQIMNDDDRNIKGTIKKAIKCSAIKKDGISFLLDEGDVLGNSLNETIKFLKNKENQDVLDKIEIKIEKSKI
jgi:hypothetical protein